MTARTAPLSGWHYNPDTAHSNDDWATWCRHTRIRPPTEDELQHAGSTDAIAAYTSEQQTQNSAIHEAAHAVLYMAAGHRICYIALHSTSTSAPAKAHVKYEPAPGLWVNGVTTQAAGERAEHRWLHETGLWNAGRAWVAERLAWRDRSSAAALTREAHGRDLTFHGNRADLTDYAWVMDRTDEALDLHWNRVQALAHHLVEHRRATGDEAARITGLQETR